MQRMLLKRYAIKHKMSIFEVIKAVKSGRLRSETVEEDGKEVTYILVDDESETGTSNESLQQPKEESYAELKAEIETLKGEVKLLKREIAQMRQMITGGVVL